MDKQLEVDLGTNFGAEQGTLVHGILEQFGAANRDNIDHPEIEKKWLDVVLDAYEGKDGIWSLSKSAMSRTKKCEKCSYNNDGKCFITRAPIEKFNGCPIGEFKDAINLVELITKDKTPKSPLNKKVIDVEKKFVLDIPHPETKEIIPVVGYIDVATELDSETVEIWDYKTGKYVQTDKQCQKDPQLLIYHLAARSIYPQYKNVVITIYYMRKSPMSFAFNEKDERGTTKALQYYWKTIRSDLCPKRRCDNPDGTCSFDWKCKNLCKPEICKKEFEKFMEQGGIIQDNTQVVYDKEQHNSRRK